MARGPNWARPVERKIGGLGTAEELDDRLGPIWEARLK
jgi:hypothetical protein